MSELAYTKFKNLTSTGGVLRESDFGSLYDVLSDPNTYDNKKSCPLIKLSAFEGNSCVSGSNMVEHYGIIGDYDYDPENKPDTPLLSYDDAKARLEKLNLKSIIYTSPSHTPERPRYRIIATLSSAVDDSSFSDMTAALNGVLSEGYGESVLASESFDVQRRYFYGKVKDTCEHFRADMIEGLEIDVVDSYIELPRRGKPKPKTESKKLADDFTGGKNPIGDKETFIQALNYLAEPKTKEALDKYNDRQTWVDVCMVLKNVPDDEQDWAYTVFDEWSSKHDKYDAEKTDDLWRGAKPNGSITAGSILHWAESFGWKNPTKKETPPFQKGNFIVNIDDSFWDEDDELDYLIDGVISEQSINGLIGESGVGKSYIALDMAYQLSIGGTFAAKPCKKTRPLYICGEGYLGVRRRVKALAKYHGESPNNISLAKSAIDLYQQDNVDSLIEEVAQTMPEPPGIIFIDTLNSCFGGEENSATDMGVFIRNINRIKDEFKCAVVVVHHKGKNGTKARGSSGFYAALDSEWDVSKLTDKAKSCIVLKNTKAKDIEAISPVCFEFATVSIDNRHRGTQYNASLVVAIGGLVDELPPRLRQALLPFEDSTEIAITEYKEMVTTIYKEDGVQKARDRAVENIKKLKERGYIVEVSGMVRQNSKEATINDFDLIEETYEDFL